MCRCRLLRNRAGSRDTNVVVTDNHLNGTNVTQNVAVSGTGLSRITPTIAWAAPSPITCGTTLSGVLGATATDGTSSVDGTFAYTATPQGGAASAVTAATVLEAGVYTLAVSFTPSSPTYTSATGSVSLTVSDLTLSIASGGSTTATVSAGGHVTYNLTIAPSTGSTFPDAVALSASGGPTGSTITFDHSTIAAGAGSTDVTVTVQVPAAHAAVRTSSARAFGLWIPLMGMLVLLFGIERRRLSMKRVLLAVLLLIVVISTGAILGCGGSTHTTSTTTTTTPSTNYTITVTATSGSVSHSTTLTLTVR